MGLTRYTRRGRLPGKRLSDTLKFYPRSSQKHKGPLLTLATRFHVVYALTNDVQRVEDNQLPVCSPTTPNPVPIRRLRHPLTVRLADINPLVAGVHGLISQNASLHELWVTTLRSQSCSALSSPRYGATEERANHCLLLSVNLLLTTRPMVSPRPCMITRLTGRPSRSLPSSHVLPNGIWFNSIHRPLLCHTGWHHNQIHSEGV